MVRLIYVEDKYEILLSGEKVVPVDKGISAYAVMEWIYLVSQTH